MIDDVTERVKAKAKRKHAGRRRVFVCSPLAGAIGSNTQLARELCLAVVRAGHAAFAPHVFYQQIGLDETLESDRQAGIECGIAWLRVADEMWIFCEERSQCSTGMLKEIELSEKLPLPPKLIWMPMEWIGFKGRGTFKKREPDLPLLPFQPTIPGSE